MFSFRRSWPVVGWVSLCVLAACGGGGGGGDSPPSGGGGNGGVAPASYTIGGQVVGLQQGDQLEISLGSQSLVVTASGGFTFPAGLGAGSSYSVLIAQTPDNRQCTLARSAGVVQTTAVTDVAITCTAANWVTDGPVEAMALSSNGSTLYFAGSFTRVGPRSGNFVAVDPNTGVLRTGVIQIGGMVRAVASDGNGGWYLGVAYTDDPITSLKHVRANGRLNSSFDVRVRGSVHALAVMDGKLYIGGNFASVGGTVSTNLAAVDAVSGAMRSSFDVRGTVNSIAAGPTQVFIGGHIDSVGNVSRSKLAALDRNTGSLLPWAPTPTLTNSIASISTMLAANGVVYVGGDFDQVAGQARRAVAALDMSTGLATGWNPGSSSAGGSTCGLALDGQTLYVGGDFTTMGGQTRSGVAALDTATGQATAWDAKLGGTPNYGVSVCRLAVSGGTVYVAGAFVSSGGEARSGLAAFSASTGALTPFAASLPVQPGRILWLAGSGSTVWIGGTFDLYGGVLRDGMAALDTRTGQVLDWAPRVRTFVSSDIEPGTVSRLLTTPNAVIVAGRFARLNNDVRRGIGAVSLDGAGTSLPWGATPGASSSPYVDALALSGDTLYFGGAFDSVAGEPRRGLAAVDATTFALRPWATTAPGQITQLAIVGNRLFASGGFQLGPTEADSRSLLAFDATSGSRLDWDPNPRSSRGGAAGVASIVATSSAVYMAGFIDTVGGVNLLNLAAVATDTGSLLPWRPSYGLNVGAFFLHGDKLFFAERPSSLEGTVSYSIRPIDMSTGAFLQGSAITFDNTPALMVATPTGYYVGGRFLRVNGEAWSRLAFVPQ